MYALYATTNAQRPSGWVYIGGEKEARGTAALAANAWTHLASTYDGANLRLYVNGTLVKTLAQTGNIAASTGALRFGGNAIWGEWFAGSLDDVRIYNKALTAAEIQADMTKGVAVGWGCSPRRRPRAARAAPERGRAPRGHPPGAPRVTPGRARAESTPAAAGASLTRAGPLDHSLTRARRVRRVMAIVPTDSATSRAGAPAHGLDRPPPSRR